MNSKRLQKKPSLRCQRKPKSKNNVTNYRKQVSSYLFATGQVAGNIKSLILALYLVPSCHMALFLNQAFFLLLRSMLIIWGYGHEGLTLMHSWELARIGSMMSNSSERF